MSETVVTVNKMWGGRFEEGPAAIMEQINTSIHFDKKLYREDICASKAHAMMLCRQGIISETDYESIRKGLDQIHDQIEKGDFEFKVAFEDIHMNIEAELSRLIGDAAGRLHTARSRNDQVITDVRLWLRTRIDEIDAHVEKLIVVLIDKAEMNIDTIMPGFTHLQIAQPVSFGHHLLAYVEMLKRDRSRLRDCRKRMNECPLGSAALAGTSYPIDRHLVANLLGFDKPTENSMDSVASRDFIAEFIFFASMISVHLSRFAEDIVLWNSDGFKFIELSDAFTSGSSIMPQKKNPDAAELLRAKPGRIVGSLNTILMMMKGLPMTFMKDMQEDKEALFDATESITLCIKVATGLVQDLQPNKDKMESFLRKGFPTATDLADWLVRDLDIPFRQAHHITGLVVALAAERDVRLEQLPLDDLQNIEPRITQDIYSILDIRSSLASRTSYGGTSPEQVKSAIDRVKRDSIC